MSDALLEMAIRCQTEPDAIPVLGDMLIEAGRDQGPLRTWAMALLLGVPLDGEIPESILLKGERARATVREQRKASLAVAESYWPQYSASCSPTWARAILAVLLFGSWRPATTSTGGDYRDKTRSPWAVARARGVRSANEIRAHRAALRFVTARADHRRLAMPQSGGSGGVPSVEGGEGDGT